MPAVEIEAFVVQQIRTDGADSTVLAETVRKTRDQAQAQIGALQNEERRLINSLGRLNAEPHNPW